jgi:vacuolar protein 8
VAIAAAGGIPVLVSLARDGSVIGKEIAAGALWNLAVNADNDVAIESAGYLG